MRDRGALSRMSDRSLGAWLDRQAPRSRLLPSRGDAIALRCVLVAVAALIGIIFFMSDWR